MTATALRVAAAAALAVVVTVGGGARAAGAPPVFEGTWIATAGSSPPLRGRWSAQALPGSADEMQGSWSMIDDAGDTVARGTWSARRSKRGFQGKWQARAATGAIYKGSFEAHLPGFKGKTLQDMFAGTRTAQISGFWRMGRAEGAWYLKGPSP
jgi:hypothetical protein